MVDEKTCLRFWKKVKKTATCWQWQGSLGVRGYGTFRWGTRTLTARRMAWWIHHRQSAGEQQVLSACGNPGCVRPTHLFLGTQADQRKRDVSERFWEKVKRTSTCWVWQGARLLDGYGAFKMSSGSTNGHQKRAHHVAWQLTHGVVPKGKQVLHTCDNRLCVRPDHLFLGTCKDNMGDKATKQRSHSARSRLTAAQIKRIRKEAEHCTYRGLAAKYGTQHGVISRIVRRITYRHID